MTAPIVIKYEDWVAVIDDANKAQERVKKLEEAIKLLIGSEYLPPHLRDIARKALEE